MLGVWLTYSYAHTHKHDNFLPYSLKGADMAFYNTACALGLKCLLVPIIAVENDYNDQVRYLMETEFSGLNEECSGIGEGSLYEEYDMSWGIEMPQSKVVWLNSVAQDKSEGKSISKLEGESRGNKDFSELQLACVTVRPA